MTGMYILGRFRKDTGSPDGGGVWEALTRYRRFHYGFVYTLQLDLVHRTVTACRKAANDEIP